jgi:hypothetical protein
MCMPVFQALQLLDDGVDKCVSVQDETAVLCGDEELCHKFGQLIRETLQDSVLVFPLCNLDSCGH